MDATPTLSPATAFEPQPERAPRPGDTCPHCGQGRLDYNGVLLLACETCGYALGEGGGCT